MANEDYLDQTLYCKTQRVQVTIRCTRDGAVVCKFPWQKCPAKKRDDPKNPKCIMSQLARAIPGEIEKRKEKFSEATLRSLLTWAELQRRVRRFLR